MQVSVAFQDEQLDLKLSGDSVVGAWTGPTGIGADAAVAAVRQVLEEPLVFPPLRQMVVPGDRVAIALDGSLGGVHGLLSVLGEILHESGVEPGGVTVVATENSRLSLDSEVPAGMSLVKHDAGDRSRLAYLSTTKEGRRIYLNRTITDADVVIPVGRLGYDPVLGYRGPWSVLFPGLSDLEAKVFHRQRLQNDPPGHVKPSVRLDESFEVSWLLGSQFHLGLVPGSLGMARALGGLAEPVRDEGIRQVDQLWNYHAPAGAECVVVGIGAAGTESGISELVDGLVTASRLVNHGGKIVAVSRARGSIGPSLQRLIAAGDAREALSALRGHDADADSLDGRRLAQVLDWADVYLQSGLDRQVVEDLSMVPIDHVDDVHRIISRSASCLVISRADLTRATVCEG